MDRRKLKPPSKQTIVALVLIAWVVLWLMFLVREVFIKGRVHDYVALAGRSFEGKHAYVTGEDLYEFVDYCRAATPADATFEFEGLEPGALEKRRVVYYLYPRLEEPEAEYIFVYRVPEYSRVGYDLHGALDKDRYILRRAKR